MKPRPPLPPFTEETARQKVQAAEDAWNSRDPERVSLAYTEDTEWRNRSEFLNGRAAVVAFLHRKWRHEHDYRLKKELWAFGGNRIAVRFEYEYHDDAGQWHRAYGNENWEFDELGYMQRRFASINDLPIRESDRKFHWEREKLASAAPKPEPTNAPSPQPFFETINAFQRTGALKAAVELGLFTAIGTTPSTSAEIAARCGCPERGIRILSDNLAILGFLTKNGSHYALTPSSAAFLDKNSPAYFGDAVKFLLAPGLTEAFTDLASTIRRGRLHTTEHGTTAPDHPAWVEFARAMGPLMAPAASGAAELAPLDPSRDTRVLDISASHGAFGIAFAKRNPRAHLVALDWEAVLAITEKNATAAGLANRFSKIVGDAFTADLGSDYDAVLVPNFLHHFNRAECTRFLGRTHAALRPGGRVVIVEFVPNDDRITPPPAASFSLVMLGTTPEGDAYTFAEYRTMLAEAGFREATLHPLPPTAECAVIATA